MASPEIILRHLKQLAEAELKRVRNIRSLYSDFRLALYDALMEGAGETMTIDRLAAYRREIDRAIDAFARKLGSGLKSSLVNGVGMAVTHATDEINALQKGVGARYVALNVRASTVLSRTEKLLVSQYDSSIARYGEHLRTRMGQVMSQAALKSASIDDVAKNLAGQRGLVNLEQYQVERIARTEYLRAYNIGRNQSTREAQKVLPDLKRRWDSTLDDRTCDICSGMDGEIVELDEPWVVDGEEVMTPQDAHPNCRCAETPYREVWEDLFD